MDNGGPAKIHTQPMYNPIPQPPMNMGNNNQPPSFPPGSGGGQMMPPPQYPPQQFN